MRWNGVQPTRCNIFSIYLFLQIVLHVSSGFSAHHQEHKTVHIAPGIVKPILLLAATVDEMERSTANKMQHFLHLFISINCCICFRGFLRPSSGAQNCTYSVRYCQTNTAACCSIGLTIPDLVCTVLFSDDGRRNGLKHVEYFMEINSLRKRILLVVL